MYPHVAPLPILHHGCVSPIFVSRYRFPCCHIKICCVWDLFQCCPLFYPPSLDSAMLDFLQARPRPHFNYVCLEDFLFLFKYFFLHLELKRLGGKKADTSLPLPPNPTLLEQPWCTHSFRRRWRYLKSPCPRIALDQFWFSKFPRKHPFKNIK